MTNKEIIFTSGLNGYESKKELHFRVDDRNCVSWQVIPKGEGGATRPFKDIVGAEGFMERYAIRLGFTKRVIQVDSEVSGGNI